MCLEIEVSTWIWKRKKRDSQCVKNCHRYCVASARKEHLLCTDFSMTLYLLYQQLSVLCVYSFFCWPTISFLMAKHQCVGFISSFQWKNGWATNIISKWFKCINMYMCKNVRWVGVEVPNILVKTCRKMDDFTRICWKSFSRIGGWLLTLSYMSMENFDHFPWLAVRLDL